MTKQFPFRPIDPEEYNRLSTGMNVANIHITVSKEIILRAKYSGTYRSPVTEHDNNWEEVVRSATCGHPLALAVSGIFPHPKVCNHYLSTGDGEWLWFTFSSRLTIARWDALRPEQRAALDEFTVVAQIREETVQKYGLDRADESLFPHIRIAPAKKGLLSSFADMLSGDRLFTSRVKRKMVLKMIGILGNTAAATECVIPLM